MKSHIVLRNCAATMMLAIHFVGCVEVPTVERPRYDLSSSCITTITLGTDDRGGVWVDATLEEAARESLQAFINESDVGCEIYIDGVHQGTFATRGTVVEIPIGGYFRSRDAALSVIKRLTRRNESIQLREVDVLPVR